MIDRSNGVDKGRKVSWAQLVNTYGDGGGGAGCLLYIKSSSHNKINKTGMKNSSPKWCHESKTRCHRGQNADGRELK